ncbi:AAA family ATPase [Undibacterium sp. SXout11W]|uniref:AAA family ATPase n=1 Tax=Undibacterium sp. SXout11W TaxID=3413050 RepID=UPI003BF3843E
MKIVSVKNSKAFQTLIKIIDEDVDVDASWVTVLIGENGTQKSLLLRTVAFSAAFEETSGNMLKISGDVSQVIALSGTPLDRFVRFNQRISKNKYTYLGLRAVNNVAGVGQCEKSFVISLISNRTLLKARASEFELVFAQLGLIPTVEIEFDVARIFSSMLNRQDRLPDLLCDRVKRHCEKILATPGSSVLDRRDAKAALKMISDEDEQTFLYEVLQRLRSEKIVVTLGTTKNLVTSDTITIGKWRILLEAGVVDIYETRFTPTDEARANWGKDEVPGPNLSSGQWNWLCTLGGLAAEVSDDSLILIDEPENSLHPAWQRDYVPTLLRILENFEGCHVLLATHSPLVASGLPSKFGNTRRLRREVNEEGTPVVQSYEAENTFGWSASDAYEALFQLETSRARLFNIDATNALAMIKNGSGTRLEREETASIILNNCLTLPVLDPMRLVMERVASSLKDGKG